ncbi:dethiobiotin synthase [Flammeovirga kamogawensis]|uniref:ATP-dependent dethiobiotin synthetase BioD n=1 Tax=Flammeovirga kamogawensis TaxID=373891 RepID=A0ABX8GW07_9BACT|nr:dethiobiotin synthase [Flammeovirga kamogawensis]MBB6461008.1 dethiobiotin synthetase [Flammeovirga kamogawensis]QWG07579.1 dethiobiotin synthase [Flammeovirga kamogawensis]TRX69391.1 dethiobiotin synthase [Flammeovirga kamogawensis]
MNIFISAIGTDSGKSVVSAIFTEALNADYWKPIQAGFPTDTETVHKLLPTPKEKLKEAYLLKFPMSPHASARKEGVQVELNSIKIPPHTKANLVIEGAGGLMVPLNDEDCVIDIVEKLNLPLVLVSNTYLGSINHSLLSIKEIQRRGLNLLGIVFNGERNEDTESIILKHAQVPCLLKVPQLDEVSTTVIKDLANQLNQTLSQHLNAVIHE